MLPNVVWLTIDALRYDHTSMADERDLTPNLRQVADGKNGQTFSRCFSHGIGTRTSSASILTGTYPSTHKVFGNTGAIPDSLETVAELFSQNGYRTLGISPNVHFSASTGLARGFDNFRLLVDTKSILRSTSFTDLIRFLFGLREYSAGFDFEKTNHSLSYLTNRIARRELSTGSQPVFAYIHYLDPHSPYRPPEAVFKHICTDIGCTPQEARSVLRDRHENGLQWTVEHNRSDVELVEALYEAEVRFVDRMVGEFIETLSDDTILVVTADHGELFGEDDIFGHRLSVHPRLTNVPLITRGLEVTERATETPIQHADVIRTVLEATVGKTGHVLGADLQTDAPNRAVVERGPINFDSIPINNDLLEDKFSPDHLYGVAVEDSYGVFEDDDDIEWFDLNYRNHGVLPSDHREKVVSAFKRWQVNIEQSQFEANESEINEYSKKRLRELGYLID